MPVVPFSTTVTTSLHYQLAPGAVTVSNGQATYALRLQKQAGTAGLPVDLSVRLPPGAVVRSAPSGGRQEGDTWRIQLTLQESTTLQITYNRP